MNKKFNILGLLILFCLSFFNSSCSKEDLPAYDGAEITKVGFYHRFAGPNQDAITGEHITVQKELSCRYDIDSEAATVNCVVTVPQANGPFTEEERNRVSQNKLWRYFKVSTACHVTPINGAPTLGTPGDWTSEHQYELKAADGTKKVWTVRITEMKR